MENKSAVATFASILVLVILALTIIKIFNISYPINITTSEKSNELSVIGEGKVEAIPDQATIEVGITVNNAETAKAAQQEIARINNKIIKSVQKLGIPKANIKTTNYSVNPNYVYYENQPEEITGYNGTASLSIKTKDISLAPKLVVAATEAGANEIRGVRYEVDKPEKYRELARNKAIDNAKEQAEKLAKDLGFKIGKVVNVVEAPPNAPPVIYSRAEGLGGTGEPSLEPGTQTITSVVTLYFEKK